MGLNEKKQAFLIVTNNVSKHVKSLYQKIKKATAGSGDVFLLFHSNATETPPIYQGLNIMSFNDGILNNSSYIPVGNKLVPGNNHFPLLKFFLLHPEYTHYWYIEDDVGYAGDWKDFFNSFSPELDADFISSHIKRYIDRPDWYWWNSFKVPGTQFSNEELFCSFNPVYRISHKALEFIHKQLSNSCEGHHEVIYASLLHKAGFSIADFNGNGIFHLSLPRNMFCTEDTMRWRPIYLRVGSRKGMLYHPLKHQYKFKELAQLIKRTILRTGSVNLLCIGLKAVCLFQYLV